MTQPDITQKNEELLVQGILEIEPNQSGRLLDPLKFGKQRPTDVFVPSDFIKRFKLKTGQFIVGKAYKNSSHKNPKIHFIETIDGLTVDQRRKCLQFSQLTSIAPNQQIKLETQDGRMTNRVIDLFCPIGKGTRGIIVAPPRTGKTTLLQDIAAGIKENHPEIHTILLLVDERPEEVTDFTRNIQAETFSSSNDEETKNHLRIAELAIQHAKFLVEAGKDVVLLLDSLTRLSRAYNNASRGGGKTMSGGLDSRALEKPRQLFSSARKTEEAGSLTIIATALIETGSRMDDLIFQEFKGTGNMEMVLDRKVSDLRIWPAFNVLESGTRKEELLLDKDTHEKINFFRRAIASMKVVDAAESLISRLGKTHTNKEFLRLLSS